MKLVSLSFLSIAILSVSVMSMKDTKERKDLPTPPETPTRVNTNKDVQDKPYEVDVELISAIHKGEVLELLRKVKVIRSIDLGKAVKFLYENEQYEDWNGRRASFEKFMNEAESDLELKKYVPAIEKYEFCLRVLNNNVNDEYLEKKPIDSNHVPHLIQLSYSIYKKAEASRFLKWIKTSDKWLDLVNGDAVHCLCEFVKAREFLLVHDLIRKSVVPANYLALFFIANYTDDYFSDEKLSGEINKMLATSDELDKMLPIKSELYSLKESNENLWELIIDIVRDFNEDKRLLSFLEQEE